METQSTPTGLRKAYTATTTFIKANPILCFVLFLILIFLAFFAIPDRIENARLQRENTLMRELLRPDGVADSTGR